MIYFVVILLLLFLSIFDEILILKKKNRTVIYCFVFFILLILVGFRGDIEPDYSHYLNIFKSSGWNNYFKDESVEIGYYYYNVLIKELGFGFQFVIFSMAFFTIFLKIRFLKQFSDNYIISIILYYCSLLFLYDFIAIRQALAMSILMFSIPYIFNQNLKKFIVCVVLACFFHISAIIILPLYFLVRKKYNNFLILAVLIGCLVLNVYNVKISLIGMFSKILPLPAFTLAKLSHYSMESEFAFISVRLLIFSFIFLFYKWYNKVDDRYNLFFNIFVIGILFTTVFNEIPQFSYRIKAYFLWTDILLWVYIVERVFRRYIGMRIFTYILLIGIYTITLVGFLQSVSERGNYIYPYKFFWEV